MIFTNEVCIKKYLFYLSDLCLKILTSRKVEISNFLRWPSVLIENIFVVRGFKVFNAILTF